MAISNDTIRTIGSAVTITTGIVVAAWFFFSLNSRVGRLEEQVHTLTVAPTIASTAPTIAPSAGNSEAVKNPLADACAELARRAVSEAGLGGSYGAQSEAEKMLEVLGCVQAKSH